MRKTVFGMTAMLLLIGSASAQSSQPGKKIVFVQHDIAEVVGQFRGRLKLHPMVFNEKRNQLALMNVDGSKIKDLKVQGNEPAISPDGSKIVFSHIEGKNQAQIFVVNADGRELKQLTNFTEQVAADPTWSPEGRKIAFTVFRNPKPRQNPDVYIMGADGSNQMKIIEQGATPSFSPDGTRIVFTSKRDGNFEIYSAKADGSDVRRLTNNKAEDSAPAWSPDGSTIVFVSEDVGVSEDVRLNAIYLMNPDGTEVQRLTFSHRQYQHLCFPSWTADGRSVLFTMLYVVGPQPISKNEDRPACEQLGGQSQIFSIDLDGSKPKRLTDIKERGIHPSMRN